MKYKKAGALFKPKFKNEIGEECFPPGISNKLLNVFTTDI